MRKGQINLLACFLAAVVLPPSLGLIEEIQTPRDILECLAYKSQNASIGEVSGRSIQDFCIRKFTLETQSGKENFAQNISIEGVQYLKSLFRQLESEVHDQKRGKRQAGTWRVRREIRTLSDAERNNVFQCFRRLKNDYSVDRRMSTYDMIASLHSGQAARMMHNGPGFLPRHMIYVLVMETACRIPMPYWDMTTDSEMMDPTQSVVWSDLFFGPGNGPVLSGPFGRFRTPTGTPIIRNIGSGGASLARKAGIRALLSRRRTFQITEPQPAQSIFSIENHHNGVHNWIDGYMSGLNTASWDPVFWFIHSFFQLLWVAFRNGQRASGINPERDYPRGVRVPSGHEFYQRMNFMPFMRRMTNLEGFSSRYDRIVQYAPMPRCSDACGGGRYFVCLRGVCVSRSRRRQPFMFRGKRSINAHEDQLADENVNPNTTNLIQSNEAALSTLNKPYQNTFMINGKVDEDAWAYIPIRVLYERPRGFNFHTSSPRATKRDMYDPENFKKEAKRIGLQNQVQYKQQCSPSGSGAGKVFVQSSGLNYAGTYKDYAIVDERQPVTSAMTYIGFKKPFDSDSELILTAYDTCGRICRPACPVYNHNRETYKACSGSFRISSRSPLMFSSTYGSAVSNTWNVREGMEPGCQSKSLPITFVCDHQNSWPWETKL